MEVILNFSVHHGTSKTGGHRSSNGWVTSWVNYRNYSLTTNTKQIRLPIEVCHILKEFLSKYENEEEKDQDWGVYIEDEHYRENIDISSLVDIINKNQNLFVFDVSNNPQEFDIYELISFSEIEYNKALKLIKQTENELKKEIENLKKEYELIKIQRLYPHFRELLVNHQINLQEYFGDTKYYPLDLICLNNDITIAVDVITRNKDVKYSYVNEVYTFLMTEVLEKITNISEEANQTLGGNNDVIYNFINNIENQFGIEKYGKNQFGNYQHLRPQLLKGMLDTLMFYLLKGDYNKYNELIQRPIYKTQKYIFDGLLKFAYLSDAKWEMFSFSNVVRTSDAEFFESRILGSVCTHTYWKPFLQKILNNHDIIEKLGQLFFFKDAETSINRIKVRILNMIDSCNKNHANYPYFW